MPLISAAKPPLKALARVPWTARLGLLVILIYAVVAIFAPLISPYPQNRIVGAEYEVWSAAFPLGTDSIGRDMLSRLIYGARNSAGIALLATGLAFSLGSVTGLLAVAVGGRLDQVLGRIVDLIMAVPALIAALMVLTIAGTSVLSLVLTIAVVDATRVYRLARSAGMNVMVMDYVRIAELRGEGLGWIVRHELLPNITQPLVTEFGMRFSFVFLFISALSFLGLGIQPSLADWGSMVRENATLISFGDVTPLLPALAIAVLTIAVNFVVDWFQHLSSGLKD